MVISVAKTIIFLFYCSCADAFNKTKIKLKLFYFCCRAMLCCRAVAEYVAGLVSVTFVYCVVTAKDMAIVAMECA